MLSTTVKSYLLTALLWLSSVACVTDHDSKVRLAIGDHMPQFEVVTLQGDIYSPQTLQGRESVIVFFNTDCPDCRYELPELQLQADAEPQVQYLCIARDEGAESIEKFWTEHNLTMPVAPQPNRHVYSLFARVGIPRTFRFSPSLRLLQITGP